MMNVNSDESGSQVDQKIGIFLVIVGGLALSCLIICVVALLLHRLSERKSQTSLHQQQLPPDAKDQEQQVEQIGLVNDFVMTDAEAKSTAPCLNCRLIQMGSAISFNDRRCPQCGKVEDYSFKP